MGAYANLIALIYDAFLIVFLAFPTQANVDSATFNWGSVIFISSSLIALLFYFTIGRHQYRDPSKDVIG